jgi:phosphocarrier protein HPr
MSGAATMHSASVMLANLAGLHGRPAVKLTQTAKGFPQTSVEFALSPDGPWTNAKSPVQVMRARASKGTILHIRADGPQAREAVEAMIALIDQKFFED